MSELALFQIKLYPQQIIKCLKCPAADLKSLNECNPRDKVRLSFNVSQSTITGATPVTAKDKKEKNVRIDPRFKKKKNLLKRIGKKGDKRFKKIQIWN